MTNELPAGETYDAIVIGGGHNGLTAALYLQKGGLKTLLLERNADLGGAVRSAELTLPGFIHDTYSTNQNLFLSSTLYAEHKDDLARHGLTYAHAQDPFACVFPGGKALRVYGDKERTLAELRTHSAEDAEGWARLSDHFEKFERSLLPMYGVALPSAAAGVAAVKAARAVGLPELLKLTQIVASSTRELGYEFFATEETKALVAIWGMHLDFGPDIAGGAMFPFLETFSDQKHGMNLAKGGASHLPDAIAGFFQELGGTVRTGAPVAQILDEDGRATGVRLESGETIHARVAVMANLHPKVLFERLLKDAPLPDEFRRQVRGFKPGPGTMMIHLALKEAPKWAAGEELDGFAYVHIGPYIEDLQRTYTDAQNGTIPESPTLIVGQTTAVDPTRTPNGEAILWVQVRMMPGEVLGDRKGEIAPGSDWDEVKETIADRCLDKLEEYAPGVKDSIIGRCVLSPKDLEQDNPCLVGGDSIAGSHHLRQNFVFRPFPGHSNYRMPLDALFMCGASTWPGAGTNATSGYLAAQEVLKPGRRKKAALGAAVGALALGAAVANSRRRGS